ncbi:MAG: PEP-CTERM sorting domain-containing protein [Akkermansiaceae bacterium]|nr:PEP-CTERM sorting domain-containing protein [Akkermansiaceae bacterium]
MVYLKRTDPLIILIKQAIIRFAAFGLFSAPLVTNAAVVSVNLVQQFASAQTVDPNTPYGVELAPFWTNTTSNTPTNLRDNTGVATTLDLTISGGSRNVFGAAQINDTSMKAGQLFSTPNSGPLVTISEIPYDNFKVVTYLTGYNGTNTQASISDGTTTYWWRPKPFAAALSQTSDTDPNDGIAQGNYAIFGSEQNPLTGNSVTLQALLGESATAGAGIGGFQIVEVVPEPSTGLLSLLALAGVILLRQRNS